MDKATSNLEMPKDFGAMLGYLSCKDHFKTKKLIDQWLIENNKNIHSMSLIEVYNMLKHVTLVILADELLPN